MDVKTTWLVVGVIMILCINAMYRRDLEDPIDIPQASIPEYFEEEEEEKERARPKKKR